MVDRQRLSFLHNTRHAAPCPSSQKLLQFQDLGRLAKLLQLGSTMGPNRNTVLVVEEDIAVRRLTLLALRNHGYRILEAFDGESGFAAFSNHQHDVDLVLTDVVMPLLSGLAMVKRILRFKPATKAVFITATSESLEFSVCGRTFPALSKPFTADQLILSVSQCLPNRTFPASEDRGRCFRLKAPTIAVFAKESENRVLHIPIDAEIVVFDSLRVDPTEPNRQVNIEWNGKALRMFAVDVRWRGERV